MPSNNTEDDFDLNSFLASLGGSKTTEVDPKVKNTAKAKLLELLEKTQNNTPPSLLSVLYQISKGE